MIVKFRFFRHSSPNFLTEGQKIRGYIKGFCACEVGSKLLFGNFAQTLVKIGYFPNWCKPWWRYCCNDWALITDYKHEQSVISPLFVTRICIINDEEDLLIFSQPRTRRSSMFVCRDSAVVSSKWYEEEVVFGASYNCSTYKTEIHHACPCFYCRSIIAVIVEWVWSIGNRWFASGTDRNAIATTNSHRNGRSYSNPHPHPPHRNPNSPDPNRHTQCWFKPYSGPI